MIEYTPKNIMDWTRLGMRKAFGAFMTSIAENHPDIIVLVADIANSGNLECFKVAYPDRFFNIGIAEQNMTGIACGLAKEGNNVFIVSFAPFVTMRNYEAIRTLVGYMHLNVKIVALASGLSLGVQGNTHYCLEDISLFRTIPGISVLSPADVVEEAKCLEYLADFKGPAYLRLTGIDGAAGVFKNDYSFDPGKPVLLREGEDVAILTTGSVSAECIRATRALKKDNISCAVYDVCGIKPFNRDFLQKELQKYKLIVSVEEHYKSGGLGSLICESLSEQKNSIPFVKVGIEDAFPMASDYATLLDKNHLTAPSIRDIIADQMKSISKI